MAHQVPPPPPTPAHTDSTLQPSRVRTPKLKYRKSICDGDSLNTVGTDASTHTLIASNPISPARSNFSALVGHPSPDDVAPFASRRPSLTPSSIASGLSMDKKPTKKQSFFSSLFSVKEPSAQALADYQRQLAKQGTLKNGRIGAPGMPGVSSTKLPQSVPKVNSKWDGTPHVMEKEKRKSGISRPSMMLASRSFTSGASTASSEVSSLRDLESRGLQSRGTLGGVSLKSAHSGGSTNKLAELYGWEVTTFTEGGPGENASSDRSRPNTSPSTTGRSLLQPTISEPATDPTEPPKIPSSYFEQLPHSPADAKTLPNLSHSSCSTPHEISPATPNTASPIISVTPADAHKTLHEPHDPTGERLRTTTIEAASNLDEVIVRSSGVNILQPPSSALRKNKLPPSGLNSGDRPETSGAEMRLKPILKKESPAAMHTTDHDSFDSNLPAPSDLDTPHHVGSIRTKIGLHPRTSESPAPVMEKSCERIVTPTPESGAILLRRKGRLSFFKNN